MTWSYTGFRQFIKCKRQWYYSNIVANALAKDVFRREVTILSKTQTLEAWRGGLVDYVISRVIISKIRNGKDVDEDAIMWVTNNIWDEQLEFAKKRKYREPGIKFSDHDDFAALINLDNDQGLGEEDLQKAKKEVHISIHNFLKNEGLIEYLRDASHLITQRPLTYSLNQFSVRGTPDLIALFTDEPPHIFDWKVHQNDTKTYTDQLLCYAVAVKKVKPHKDFPIDIEKHKLEDYRLSEFQLLTDEIRDYAISSEDIDYIQNQIASGVLQLYQSGANRKYKETTYKDFSTTSNALNCTNCRYQLICKKQEK